MAKRIVALFLGMMGLASAASAEIKNISAGEAHSAAVSGTVILIDVRTPSEWAMTGLPEGAIGADMHEPDFVDRVIGAVAGDFDAPVALICRTGRRSHQAAQDLAESGFTNLLNVSEGMAGRAGAGQGWIAHGLPTARYEAN